MSEKFCLKWNDFESNVSKSFGLLRNEEYLHDVTLVCDDNSQVSAHKLVLSACSEYFKTIFRNNSHPNPLICLEGISSPELRNILDYMYNGEANIFQENLEEFLSLAQRLKISGLLKSENNDISQNCKPEDYIANSKSIAENLGTDSSNMTSPKDTKHENIVSVHNNGEIDRVVDEYIETTSDGNLKCTFCGKLRH